MRIALAALPVDRGVAVVGFRTADRFLGHGGSLPGFVPDRLAEVPSTEKIARTCGVINVLYSDQISLAGGNPGGLFDNVDKLSSMETIEI